MKIMASDFDGTIYFGLLGDGQGFKEEDLKAIAEFRKNGHKFGVCSGRPLLGITSKAEGILDFDFYILSSGAVILDENKNLLYEESIPHDIMVQLAEEFYEKRGDVWIHAKHGIYVKDNLSPVVQFKQVIVHDFKEIPDEIISSVSFGMDDEEGARLACIYIQENYPMLDAFYNDRYVDIVVRGVSKGNALRKYAQMIESEDTYGIGDNYNDLAMFEGAKTSYSFHYSPKEVQDASTHVVDSVAEAIRQIL